MRLASNIQATPATAGADAGLPASRRLNLLLGEGAWRGDALHDQLPGVLKPIGIDVLRAQSARAAAQVAEQIRIHIAVIDISIPVDETHAVEAGQQVLQLLMRIPARPPVVVVRPPQPSQRASARLLSDALRGGAFAVLDRPLQLEAVLEVLRRVVQRHYAGMWRAG